LVVDLDMLGRWRLRVGDLVDAPLLSDAIPRATSLPGQRITCRVTPLDGRLAGPTSSITTVSE
jgi:hypothetical protein